MNGDECGSEIDFQALAICWLCGGVHGPVWESQSAGRVVRREQYCDCIVVCSGMDQWPGYDFPTAVELCRCCGRAALRSGSRWSDWFCRACKPFIEDVNQAYVFPRIPLGRHSLRTQITCGPDFPADRLPQLPHVLGDWFEKIERIERHGVNVVFRNLPLTHDLLIDSNVPLPAYLERLNRSVLVQTKAVRSLGHVVGIPRKILDRVLPRP